MINLVHHTIVCMALFDIMMCVSYYLVFLFAAELPIGPYHLNKFNISISSHEYLFSRMTKIYC